MLPMLSMCSQCAQWVFGPLSPVTITMPAYQFGSIGQRARRMFQRREGSPFIFNVNEHAVGRPGYLIPYHH